MHVRACIDNYYIDRYMYGDSFFFSFMEMDCVHVHVSLCINDVNICLTLIFKGKLYADET